MDNREYVILDTSRNKYWKYNDYGYTEDLQQARLFTLDEALEKVNAPYVKDLKILLEKGK